MIPDVVGRKKKREREKTRNAGAAQFRDTTAPWSKRTVESFASSGPPGFRNTEYSEDGLSSGTPEETECRFPGGWEMLGL